MATLEIFPLSVYSNRSEGYYSDSRYYPWDESITNAKVFIHSLEIENPTQRFYFYVEDSPDATSWRLADSLFTNRVLSSNTIYRATIGPSLVLGPYVRFWLYITATKGKFRIFLSRK